ncbi:MAG: DnaD domain protein [Clostridia bacterium]|nr:DnaD domain protein [Clostridia bacterium]
MAFCSFSKDCDGNSFVTVENKFITKYLPEADGLAVKVYLYGLYLCKNADGDFSIQSMAEVLRVSVEDIVSAFTVWADYDLVQIVSKSPFMVQYLPVRNAVGKPKRIHYEQYADFNAELQRKMQRVGKFVSAGDYRKYMQFLEETSMQPQALLLIAEYCISKQGESVSPSYVFNKAKVMLKNGLYTYEQVEKELSKINANKDNVLALFTALGITGRSPEEDDYALYKKWTESYGFPKESLLVVAKKTKRGSLPALQLTLEDLREKGKTDAKELERYLSERETATGLAFRIARKLGVKISNPAPYVDEYVEKWITYGFEDSSLLDIALFCLKTDRGDFDSMHAIVEKLLSEGIISKEQVKAYLKGKNDELKLFEKLREICGSVRKNATTLSLIGTWRSWKFSDDMILEAGRRSASSSSPIPYMNKILSDWKQAEVFTIDAIPQSTPKPTSKAAQFVSATVEATNAKTDRERYYALLREKAQIRADKTVDKANANPQFKEITSKLSLMEITLAKAEVRSPQDLPALRKQKQALLQQRKDVLLAMGLTEEDLLPKYVCTKCNDTGFTPNGTVCGCYKQ